MLCNIASKSRDSRDRANTVDMTDLWLRLDDKGDAENTKIRKQIKERFSFFTNMYPIPFHGPSRLSETRTLARAGADLCGR